MFGGEDHQRFLQLNQKLQLNNLWANLFIYQTFCQNFYPSTLPNITAAKLSHCMVTVTTPDHWQAEREAMADEESSYALRANRRSREPAPLSRGRKDVKVFTAYNIACYYSDCC